VNAASLNVWPPTIKIALPFAAIVPIYVPYVLDLRHGAQHSANNCTHFVRPFAKHAIQNARNTPGTWNVAEFAQLLVITVLNVVTK
jgi:hypothetical protein